MFHISNISKKMESKDKYSEIDIENRTPYYFDDIIMIVKDLNIRDILLDEK